MIQKHRPSHDNYYCLSIILTINKAFNYFNYLLIKIFSINY